MGLGLPLKSPHRFSMSDTLPTHQLNDLGRVNLLQPQFLLTLVREGWLENHLLQDRSRHEIKMFERSPA